MRKIVAGLFMSLDGVVGSPENWQFPYADEESQAEVGKRMARADTFLFGRVTYEGFAAFWPQQDNEMAYVMNAVPKVVVSTTLESADWHNTTVVRTLPEVKALKERDGGDIRVTGSITLVRSLLAHGLLDELELLLHPVLVGTGTRLFDNGSVGHALHLVASRALRNGVLALTYQPAPAGH